MSKQPTIDLQNCSLPELQALIEQATLAKHQVHKKAIAQAKADVEALLAERGLSFEEVFKVKPATTGQGTRAGIPVAPKYANPADATQTWSGRGKRPHWMRDAIEAGHTLESLAIKA